MYLKNLFYLTLSVVFITFFSFSALSQKGISPAVQIHAEVNTNYPQQEDFKPSLVKRLIVPPGFTVWAAATGLGKPRMMAVGEQGYLYVTRRDVGDVLMLKDLDNNGVFDEIKTIVSNYKGVHGITINNGWLYLCSDKKLARGHLEMDGTVGPLDTLANDLPDGGQHDNRTLAFGPDGKLYISIGSDCNDCRETNPEHATLLQANPDGSNRRIFARNLRNTIGFDWHPQTGELWGMDHGSDYKGDTIPPEELNKIIDGGDYGWPLVYGKQQPDNTREDPLGSTKEQYALTTEPAVLTFPAHSAPIAFVFIHNDNIPAIYQNNALVTWHGSWNRKHPEGFNVQRIKFQEGKPYGVEDFLTGFFNPTTNKRFGRPAGLIISATGDIYISDDANGVIYCVSKKGSRSRHIYSKN